MNASKLAKEAIDVGRVRVGVSRAKSRLSAFNRGRAARWAQFKVSGVSKKSLDTIHKMNERIEGRL